MCDTLVTGFLAIIGTLLGTWLGYVLSTRQSDKNFRRTVLRDIAFEYRRLAEPRDSGGLHGLIKAGICQCANNDEYLYVLELIDDLQPKIPVGHDWRPKNGDYVEFFTRLKEDALDPTDKQQMDELKKRIENR